MSGLLACQWTDASGRVLKNETADTDAVLGVVFPEQSSAILKLSLSSLASGLRTPYTLTNIRFYLTGDAVNSLLQWAPDFGLDISSDGGVSWTRFSASAGNPADATTWIPMSGKAVNATARDGLLGPLDVAMILLRLTTPPNPTSYGLYRFEIGIDLDLW